MLLSKADKVCVVVVLCFIGIIELCHYLFGGKAGK